MMNRSTMTLCSVLAAIALAGCEPEEPEVVEQPPAAEPAAEEPEQPMMRPMTDVMRLTVAEDPQLGSYLADDEGRALYLFEADTAGESTCYDACAEAWPPALVRDSAVADAPEVDETLIDTTARRTGEMQVTYNDHPLYYYQRDEAAGQTMGHDMEDFGAEWYLVTPEGEALEQPTAEGEES